MKIVDLQLNIDGLKVSDNDSVDDIIKRIEFVLDTVYPINYEILYEEIL